MGIRADRSHVDDMIKEIRKRYGGKPAKRSAVSSCSESIWSKIMLVDPARLAVGDLRKTLVKRSKLWCAPVAVSPDGVGSTSQFSACVSQNAMINYA